MRRSYRIVLHAPDRHLEYDGTTADEIGVGGGITARIRLAAALARLGHRVTVHANCRTRAVMHDVEYLPLELAAPSSADVLIVNTTGGDLDLEDVDSLPTKARLRIVWIGGKPKPRGLDTIRFDYLYVVSNFLRDTVVEQWSVPARTVFVAYNGVEERHYRDALAASEPRDPFRMIYSGHPEKGLETAREILTRLRQIDKRYTLHVYGDESLWGQVAEQPRDEPGITYHGVIGQRALATELTMAGVALHLQSIEEAFGIAVAESMRAGCIVIASPVGAIPELIRNNEDGFLLSGQHHEKETQARAVKLIRMLTEHPDFASYVRSNARTLIWTWDRMARVWAGHWDRVFGNGQSDDRSEASMWKAVCPSCGGELLLLADGYHCTRCARYLRRPDETEKKLLPKSKASKRGHPMDLATVGSELELREKQIEVLTQELASIEGSISWAFVGRVRSLLYSLAPSDTWRGRTVEAGKDSIRKLLFLGLGGLLPRMMPKPARQLGRRAWESIHILRMRDSVSRWSSQLTEIAKTTENVREVLVFPPGLDWRVQLFQRPQQLAMALARKGALVFYMEPSSSSRDFGLHEEEDRLYICKVPARVFSRLTDAVIYTLTWNRGHLVNFNVPRLIYDFVDDLQVFHTDDPEELKRDHIELLRRATLVLATAEALHEQVLAERPDALLCPNGVDYDHFAPASATRSGAVPDDLVPLLDDGVPIIGYYGALARWFDYGLLRSVAAARQDLKFVLIGPDFDGSLKRSGLRHLLNVHWLGAKSYGELPSYLRHFDVGIIPFKLNQITHATSPLKLFEYMAGGKPVLVTPMRESMRYRGVIAAEGQEGFSDGIDRALEAGRDSEYLSLIDRVARQNTWQIRAEAILNALSAMAGEP